MKFSDMSPAGAYAPTATDALPGGNFRFRSFSLLCLCSQQWRSQCRPADPGWAVFDRQK